jgi:hypothetical protein
MYTSRVEAVYELAYLRIFILWEAFLEESFLRLVCGYELPGSTHVLSRPAFRTIALAKSDVYGGADYVSWVAPSKIVNRARRYARDLPHETVISSVEPRLAALNAVRNRVAHGSDSAKRSFDAATMTLAGRRYRGASPGRFLRDWETASALSRQRWLKVIGDDLARLAAQIAP